MGPCQSYHFPNCLNSLAEADRLVLSFSMTLTPAPQVRILLSSSSEEIWGQVGQVKHDSVGCNHVAQNIGDQILGELDASSRNVQRTNEEMAKLVKPSDYGFRY